MVYSRPETDAWITDVRPHVWPMRKLFQGVKSLLYLDSDCLSWLQTTSLALIDPQGPAWNLVSNSNPLLSLMFILENPSLISFSGQNGIRAPTLPCHLCPLLSSFMSYYLSWPQFFCLRPAPRPTNPRIVSFIPPGCFFSPALQMNARQPDGSTNCIINYSNSLLRSLPQPPVTYEGYIHL